MPEISKKLYLRKDGKVESAKIYDSLDDLIPSKPFLPVRVDSKKCFVQLDEVGAPNATCGRVRIGSNIYQISSNAIFPIDVKYSLDYLTFRDGSSFPGTNFVLGSITANLPHRIKVTYHYEYRANEPREGMTGTRVVVGTVTGPEQVKSANVSSNSFDAEATISIEKGTFDIQWQGYKPQWHGMSGASGWVKITNQF